MTAPAISVENLSKAYRIGLKEKRSDTMVGAFQSALRAPWENWKRLARLNTFRHQKDAEDLFWALRDVSFEVQEGEVIGIIGRNGAGKSTLLKILSRITEPTRGRAVIRGRVSSLLEVGTGFHPDLTGRDNVYMNGTILGMTKREIDRKFDEIVDFSGIEKFLDTQIKHYSSGMKVRLAFAVAAHLEPEILIIDEVLAVGDMEFQKRCLGKMRDVAGSGRTVLFVSHNLSAVRSLCGSCVVLDRGRLQVLSHTDQALSAYEHLVGAPTTYELAKRHDRDGNGAARITGIVFMDEFSVPISSIPMGQSLQLRLSVAGTQGFADPQIAIIFFDSEGRRLFRLLSSDHRATLPPLHVGTNELLCRTAPLPLAPGCYSMTVVLKDNSDHLLDRVHDAARLFVTADDVFGGGRVPCHGDLMFLWSQWTSADALGASKLASSNRRAVDV
jgi:lipopolysaccharide transport system ATP-binding protein